MSRFVAPPDPLVAPTGPLVAPPDSLVAPTGPLVAPLDPLVAPPGPGAPRSGACSRCDADAGSVGVGARSPQPYVISAVRMMVRIRRNLELLPTEDIAAKGTDAG